MKTIATLGLLLLTPLIGFAYAEEHYVELSTEDGFIPEINTILHGSSVIFHVRGGDVWNDVSNPCEIPRETSWESCGIKSGYNFLQEGETLTYTSDTCGTFEFNSTFHNEVYILDVVNCPVEESVSIIPQNTTDPDDGFTGWKNEGTEMVSYKDGVKIASFEIFGTNTEVSESIDNPIESVTNAIEDTVEDTTDTTILHLRIEIMKLLKGILELLVRV